MDRIELAARRYRQIVPLPNPNRDRLPVRALEAWLKDNVATLVAEFVDRAKFRDLATWPVRVFRKGSDNEARRQVDATGAALIRQAGLLLSALRSRRVESAIRQTRRKRIVEEEIQIGPGEVKSLRRTTDEVDRYAELTGQCESIARPYWLDLVNPDDYFQPRSGWMRRDPVPEFKTENGAVIRSTDGDFVLSFNPEFPAIGDFVTRALFRRVEILTKNLEDARRAVVSAVRTSGRSAPNAVVRAVEDSNRLNETVLKLHSVCRPTEESSIRESCVVLAQIYSAFHPIPETGWLGLPEIVIAMGRMTIRRQMSNLRNLELTDRVAAALGDLGRLYAAEPPGQSALEEAVARGGLVLALEPVVAYWDGKPIATEWSQYRRPWEYFVALGRKARTGSAVLELDLFEDDATSSAMATLTSRLRGLLPWTLRRLIVRGTEPRSYRLELDASKVTIIESNRR